MFKHRRPEECSEIWGWRNRIGASRDSALGQFTRRVCMDFKVRQTRSTASSATE